MLPRFHMKGCGVRGGVGPVVLLLWGRRAWVGSVSAAEQEQTLPVSGGSLKMGCGQDDVFPCPQHRGTSLQRLLSRQGACQWTGPSANVKMAVLLPHHQRSNCFPLVLGSGEGLPQNQPWGFHPSSAGKRGEKESLQVPGAQAELGMRKERGFKVGVSPQFPGLDFA